MASRMLDIEVRPDVRPVVARDPRWAQVLLIVVSTAFVLLFIVTPLINVFTQAFSRGVPRYFAALGNENTLSAAALTLFIAGICVPLNTVFGLTAAWAITKFDFRGKGLLVTLI